MNRFTIAWKELRERPGPFATSVLVIFLGVAALVATRHVMVFSEREVARQLQQLGANILVLPKSATLQDYYSADLHGETLPEQHVASIMLAGLTGVEKLAPRFCVPVQLNGQAVTLTGILPQSEFQTKAAWQTTTLFNRKKHVGCKNASCSPTAESLRPEALAEQRTIHALKEFDAVIGADAAERFKLKAGATLSLFNQRFQVLAVLPPTGTVDDSRIFAHLHTVQRLTNAGEVVNAIEVLGCCEDAAGQLVPELSKLLPDTRVITIAQVVQTQVSVNRLMARGSVLATLVLIIVGGASILNTMWSNVRERRREIGTLMALGAAPRLVASLFLLKAVWLGLVGGVAGSVAGTLLSIWLGPEWAGTRVTPLPAVIGIACGATVVIAMFAAYWPARQAARLDPCATFREV